MYILAIESSGNVASAAIAGKDKILAEYTVNIGKTHSQTLLPMIDRVLSDAEMTAEDLDAIAVSRGPGSFTGLRIGSATAKGLAASAEIPILEVPTLEALAVGVGDADGRLICPVIDARRNEVYTALFKEKKEENPDDVKETTIGFGMSLVRIGEERAMSMDDLLTELVAGDREVIFTGDALRIHGEKIRAAGKGKFLLAPLSARDLRAGCVATVGLAMLEEGKAISGSQHSPVYLRLSSAERERLEQGKTLE